MLFFGSMKTNNQEYNSFSLPCPPYVFTCCVPEDASHSFLYCVCVLYVHHYNDGFLSKKEKGAEDAKMLSATHAVATYMVYSLYYNEHF